MKKILILLASLSLFFISCGNTQENTSSLEFNKKSYSNNPKTVFAKTFNGWTTIRLGNEIEFQIPPTLEIQSNDYKAEIKKTMDGTYNVLYPQGVKQIIAQQKGLNDKTPESLSRYVNVNVAILNCTEKMPSFGSALNLTESQIEEYNNVLRGFNQTFLIGNKKNVLKVTNITVPAKVIKVNGNECVYMAYDSQLNNSPIVKNELFFFFNYHKMYRVMTMIRSTEYDTWTKKEFNVREVVQTLKLVD